MKAAQRQMVQGSHGKHHLGQRMMVNRLHTIIQEHDKENDQATYFLTLGVTSGWWSLAEHTMMIRTTPEKMK
jgi:spore germination cell wall hydrolase CwlJ-like protein